MANSWLCWLIKLKGAGGYEMLLSDEIFFIWFQINKNGTKNWALLIFCFRKKLFQDLIFVSQVYCRRLLKTEFAYNFSKKSFKSTSLYLMQIFSDPLTFNTNVRLSNYVSIRLKSGDSIFVFLIFQFSCSNIMSNREKHRRIFEIQGNFIWIFFIKSNSLT